LLFSAHAEVFPIIFCGDGHYVALLRTRGGISAGATVLNSSEPSSPHTRRYFLSCLVLWVTPILFSAHAEVFPLHGFTRCRKQPLLRTRGGISFTGVSRAFLTDSSPHTRRYFPRPTLDHVPGCLFSAHAEVFPDIRRQHWLDQSLLRTRGGISELAHRCASKRNSSPHTRRYFRARAHR